MARRTYPLLVTLCTLAAAVLLPAGPASAAGDVRGGDRYRTGGGNVCTVSFSVLRPTPPYDAFLTAGHCGQAGAPVYALSGELMGYFAASSFPGNDYALVQLNPGWTALGEVRTGTGTVAVKGAASAPIGATTCRYGATTGWRCGIVQAKNQTVNYPEGTIHGLTRTSVCAEPGDTAGPFMSGNQAQGILVGGSGNCTSGGTSWFQPVGEVLSAYGVRLATS